jgi:hypothetical protein
MKILFYIEYQLNKTYFIIINHNIVKLYIYNIVIL